MKQWMEQIGKSRRLVIAILAAGLLLAALFLVPKLFGKEQTPEIFTTSALQRIIKVSELSTLSSVYNGIAQVPSPKNPQEVGYYVSYRAQVKAGIAFDAVEVLLDETERVITVKIPPAAITEVNVDISSLDYIFWMNPAILLRYLPRHIWPVNRMQERRAKRGRPSMNWPRRMQGTA